MNQAEEYLQKLIDLQKSPSVSYHIFSQDNTIYQFKKGFADIARKIKITDHTTFNAFSVTKTFTALAILQLAQQKRLDIEQPANKYLPHFPYSSNIAVRQLLTHSSGIPNPIPLSWIHLSGENKRFDRNLFFNEVILKHSRARSKPNEKFSYSNLGYFLLGRIIENISGMDYERFVQVNIIEKLNLQPNDLDFIINDFKNHAKGYIERFSFSNILLGFFIDKSKYMANAEGKWKPFNEYYVNGTSYGGLIGTSNAFVKYIQDLLLPDSKLITPDYKKILFSENFTRENKATGMCASWFTGKLKGKQYFAHAGGGGGYYCEIRIYPEFKTGSVVMFNRTGLKDERILNNIDSYFM